MIAILLSLVVILQEPDILSILEAIGAKFGLQVGGLVAAAATITLVVNFLKATKPFSEWIFNSRVPYIVGGLAVATGLFNYWGQWTQVAVSAIIITVLSIGGWATAKTLAHKAGTPASNASGGAKS